MANIPLFEIDWEESDLKHVTNSIQRGSYWTKGPYVDKLEETLEEYLGVSHALTVNSGTTALVAALKAMGVSDGDEVIVPSFTFIATANAVKLAGGTPVFADIEEETYGLDPVSVKAKITDRTKAILPVHVYGTASQIEAICRIADEHNIAVLEDNAEALGAEYNGQKLGSFGKAATLSFCQNKIVATGDGGAVVTDDDELAQQIKLYRSHGRATANYFDSADSGSYVDVGTNIRMSDITAALGYSQMNRVETLIDKRRSVAEKYTERFEEIQGVKPHAPSQGATHVYQLYTIELDSTIHRDKVINALSERDIASKVYWDPPVHRTEYYRESLDIIPDLPVTEDIASRVLSLPMHPNLSEEEIAQVVGTIKEVVS